MNKSDFISLIRKNGIYDTNPDYLSYLYSVFGSDIAPLLSSSLNDKKPLFSHDIWNAYSYGNTIKVVYIKNRFNPKKNKDFKYISDIKPVNKSVDERLSSSISRARSRIFELASCNEFQHFCTFTVNEKYKNRYDLPSIRRDLAMLFRNINRDLVADNKIKYVLIPEQHKKGGWHLHGLAYGLEPFLNEFKLSDNIPLKLKKMIKNGEKVYDFPRYSSKFGYFTATKIKDPNACSVYLTKYITKEMGKKLLDKGQHLFFASQGLKGREVIVKNCFDPAPFTKDPPPKKKGDKPCKQPADTWDFVNKYVKIKTVSLSEKTDSE